LGPHPGIKGPLPKIVPLLLTALRHQGNVVVQCGWGRRRDQESLGEKIFGRLLDILRILRELRRYGPDIFLVISTLDDRSLLRDNLLLLASLGLKLPTVMQFHGSRLDAIGQPGQPIFKAAARMLFSLCEGVIVSSHEERQALSWFSPRQRFFVADNIYHPEFCAPSSQVPPGWNLPPGKPIVFFAARLIPEKGILDLLTAIPLILQKIPCHFLLAGGGPLEPEIRERLSRSPWKEHTSWVGYLDWPHLELAYNLTSIFVLPTYHDEGFPAVIHDALGHGLPIVTTPVRGLADHLADGIHARLVPPQNPVELARAVVELLEDPILRQRMGTANREKSLAFRPDVVVPQYLRIFGQIIGPKAGRN
jgi:glycosyltransferase involved in cell wall biosynthesis